MRMRTFLAALATFAIGGTLPPAHAIEVAGDPPDFLSATLRPRWRLVDLEDVLNEISTLVEKPVARSEEVEDFESPVVLIEEGTLTVRETLELLERSQDLHFRVEPLRISAMTGSEHRRTSRRLVNVSLRDFGLFFQPRDFDAPEVGFAHRFESSRNGDFELPSPEDVLEKLTTLALPSSGLSEDGEASMRGEGNLWVHATEAEEAALRKELAAFSELSQRSSRFRVRFGYLPPSVETAGCFLPLAELERLAADLEGLVTLELSVKSGQQAAASALDQEATFVDAEVNQTGPYPVLNPVLNDLGIGKSAQLRAFHGLDHTLLESRLAWAEREGEPRAQHVGRPAKLDAGSAKIDVQASEGNKRDVKGSAAIHAPTVDPGLEFDITQQPHWVWRPAGEVFLTAGVGLALIAPRGDRRAAALIEEVRQ